MIRLFISEDTPAFAQSLTLTLGQDQSRYLTAVMRQGPGDKLCVFNGREGEWLAHIAAVGKKSVTLQLDVMTRTQPKGQGPVLAVALVKRSALETIVEKATELGVAAIQPVVTQRTNAGHTNVERLVSIAKEAAEQTERLDVPAIHTPVKLAAWLADEAIRTFVFADESSTSSEADNVTPPAIIGLHDLALKPSYAIASTAILIGPEGGFDSGERQMLRADTRCQPVNLGPRILRADTAAISALTLFQAILGDWR